MAFLEPKFEIPFKSQWNKDLDAYDGDVLKAREAYLGMAAGFNSRMPDPNTLVEEYEDKFIFRADKAPAGLKAYGAEQLIAETEEDVLVYVAPRTGHAPDAIATLANMYGKRCVFFCPASKSASDHQAAMLGHGNVDLRFVRIAAMPVLNQYAKEWAEQNGAKFLPFGLTGSPLVTAGLIRMCDDISTVINGTVCAVSTGTMIRALQIGFPNVQHYGMAVARNIKAGEIGHARVISSYQAFQQKAKIPPPFPSTATYDAKAWDLFEMLDIPGSMFINVGSDDMITSGLKGVDRSEIDSAREWGDHRDIQRSI